MGARQLVVLGGVRYGGYRGDVADCHIVQLWAPGDAPSDASHDGPSEAHVEWRQVRSEEEGGGSETSWRMVEVGMPTEVSTSTW